MSQLRKYTKTYFFYFKHGDYTLKEVRVQYYIYITIEMYLNTSKLLDFYFPKI